MKKIPIALITLLALASALLVPLTQLQAQSTSQLRITRTLTVGTHGSDVSALQQFLMGLGYFTYPTITGFYGSATWKAVAAFQHDQGLEAVGYVGPLTRKAIATLSGGGTAQTTTTTTTTTSNPNTTTTTTSTASNNPLCAAPAGLTCIPGTSIIEPIGGGLVAGGGGFGGGGGGAAPIPVQNDVAPVISAIATSTPDYSTATSTWTTDKPATSKVEYGLTTSYGSVSNSLTLTTSHQVLLTGLVSGSTYHYRISSTDTAGSTSSSGDQTFTTLSATPVIVYLTATSSSTWTVPANWGSHNFIETIGGGGSGAAATNNSSGSGGGGGAWNKVTSVTLTPGSPVTYKAGAGGAAVSAAFNSVANGNLGGDTWFCNTNSSCGSILGGAVIAGSKGGGAGQSSGTGASGGSGLGGVGTYYSNGGNSGTANVGLQNHNATGGGGAGGINGSGGSSASNISTDSSRTTSGGAGDNGHGGAAGLNSAGGTGESASEPFGQGGAGGNGTEYDSSHGSGAGGGGGYTYNGDHTGGAGGLYGGGGSAIAEENNDTIGPAISGAGGQGLITIEYYPAGVTPPPPPAVTSLGSTPAPTTIRLNWSSGGGATTHYITNIAAGSSAPSCTGGTVSTSTSIVEGGLTVGSTYTISVCALDAFDTISSRTSVTATTLTYVAAGAAPSIAASAGYNTATFFDDFNSASDIDVNDTGNVGSGAYQWFTDNPGYGDSSNLPAGDISVSGSALTLASDVSGSGYGISTFLATTTPSGVYTKPNWGGTGFENGAYFEVRASYDPSKGISQWGPPVPTAWTEGYLGISACSSNTELDLFEAFGTTTSPDVQPVFSVNYWTSSGPGPSCTFTSYVLPNNQVTASQLGNPDFSQMHTYGTLWIPASKNGGTNGLIERFFDGVHIPSLDLTYTDGSGNYPTLDQDIYGLILGTGVNWPMNVDWVKVWQTAPSDEAIGPNKGYAASN